MMDDARMIVTNRGRKAGSKHPMPRFFGSAVMEMRQGGVVRQPGSPTYTASTYVMWAYSCSWDDTRGVHLCLRHRRAASAT